MTAHKKPTCTKLVLDYLIGLDDFATRGMVVAGAGVTVSQITATLHDLKRYKAIDVMDVDGALWFYATPDADTRMRHTLEIKDQITRNRKPKKRTAVATHSVEKADKS
jgi:hypothetical protein